MPTLLQVRALTDANRCEAGAVEIAVARPIGRVPDDLRGVEGCFEGSPMPPVMKLECCAHNPHDCSQATGPER